MNRRKLLKKIISGSKNIRFADLINLVRGFGFELSRTEGSHHIFSRLDIPELVNLQNVKGEVKSISNRSIPETSRKT